MYIKPFWWVCLIVSDCVCLQKTGPLEVPAGQVLVPPSGFRVGPSRCENQRAVEEFCIDGSVSKASNL